MGSRKVRAETAQEVTKAVSQPQPPLVIHISTIPSYIESYHRYAMDGFCDGHTRTATRDVFRFDVEPWDVLHHPYLNDVKVVALFYDRGIEVAVEKKD